jgi:hypothetical protein
LRGSIDSHFRSDRGEELNLSDQGEERQRHGSFAGGGIDQHAWFALPESAPSSDAPYFCFCLRAHI